MLGATTATPPNVIYSQISGISRIRPDRLLLEYCYRCSSLKGAFVRSPAITSSSYAAESRESSSVIICPFARFTNSIMRITVTTLAMKMTTQGL